MAKSIVSPLFLTHGVVFICTIVVRQEKLRLERERMKAEQTRMELEQERRRQERELAQERERLERQQREARQQAPSYRHVVNLLISGQIHKQCPKIYPKTCTKIIL